MIGKRLGNWVITDEIGRGGMGCVYLARTHADVADEPRRAAIKVLAAPLVQEPGFVERFEREIAALGKLQHPNIIRLYEAGQEQGTYYYVMEYVDGQNFEKLLRERGRLPWDEVLELALQICPALKHAHDHGIIHRDIKPQNLLLSADGVVKLTDFGIAKVFTDPRITATKAVVGTAEFMSPEQASGKPVTRRSDLYSLGVVLYALVTGRSPFQAESVTDMLRKQVYARFDRPRHYVPELPHDFDALICQLLDKDPDQRPPDAAVVARHLERLRRRSGLRSDLTQDQLRQGATLLADGSSKPLDGSASSPSHSDLETANATGWLARGLNRAWVLLLLLAVIIALIVWGLQPKSAAAVLNDVRQAIAESDWDRATKQLDQLEARQSDRGDPAEIAQLRQQIETGRTEQRLGRHQAAFVPPSSEAERLYRQAYAEYLRGNPERARQLWLLVIDGYSGIPSRREWVELSKQALADSDKALDESAVVEEAIRLARTESPDLARKRLEALLHVYQSRADEKSASIRNQLKQALDQLSPP